MELIELAPEVVAKKQIPREEITVAPLGDLQLGSKNFAESSFKDHLSWVGDNFPNVWYLGMGDMIDFMSPSNRTRYSDAKFYDDTRSQIDDLARRQNEKVYGLLKQTEGRWLGLLSGHHFHEYSDGGNTDIDLCQMLGAPYLGYCASVEVGFARDDGKGNRGSIQIWAHHGVGAGKQPLGKLERDIVPHFPGHDIFLMGHYHMSESKDFPRLVRSGKQIISRPAVLACTGGWLKGYTSGTSGYVERGMLKPRVIGGMVIQVNPKIIKGRFMPEFVRLHRA